MKSKRAKECREVTWQQPPAHQPQKREGYKAKECRQMPNVIDPFIVKCILLVLLLVLVTMGIIGGVLLNIDRRLTHAQQDIKKQDLRFQGLQGEFDIFKSEHHPVNEDVPKSSPPLTPEPDKETPLLQPVPESCWKEKKGCP